MRKARRLILVLIIFLGPGFAIWYISKTFENYFVELPYLGYTYSYDSTGKVIDSVAYNIPEFELTGFDGSVINRDSIKGKFIVLTTIQDGCPELNECGLSMWIFNEIFFEKLADNQDNYGNVKVLSILTDENGSQLDSAGEKIREEMSQFNPDIWWTAYGAPLPFYNFPYYGKMFNEQPSSPENGEIGRFAFVSSLVLIDDKGFIRGVTGAKSDTDIRNFFDLLKLLKKEEFNKERGQRERPR